MRAALAQARAAFDAEEVPIGAVLVVGSEVIAAGQNATERRRNPLAHAELLAILAAAEQLQAWRLADATLYCTVEPCPMCAGAILQARLKRLVYGARQPRLGADGSWVALLPQQQPAADAAEAADDTGDWWTESTKKVLCEARAHARMHCCALLLCCCCFSSVARPHGSSTDRRRCLHRRRCCWGRHRARRRCGRQRRCAAAASRAAPLPPRHARHARCARGGVRRPDGAVFQAPPAAGQGRQGSGSGSNRRSQPKRQQQRGGQPRRQQQRRRRLMSRLRTNTAIPWVDGCGQQAQLHHPERATHTAPHRCAAGGLCSCGLFCSTRACRTLTPRH